jgi:hypothetical protein
MLDPTTTSPSVYHAPPTPSPARGTLAAALVAIAAAGCQSRAVENPWLEVRPGAATIGQGETLLLSARSDRGSEVEWSVEPAGCGAVTPAGAFTARTAGACTVSAMWHGDRRYTARSFVTVVAAAPLEGSLLAVEASGAAQADDGGTVANQGIAGEATPALESADGTGTTVRHGFTIAGAAP